MIEDTRPLMLTASQFQDHIRMVRDWRRWSKNDGPSYPGLETPGYFDGALIARVSSVDVPIAREVGGQYIVGRGKVKLQRLWYKDDNIAGTGTGSFEVIGAEFMTGLTNAQMEFPAFNISLTEDFAEDDVVVVLPLAHGRLLILSSVGGGAAGEGCTCICISSGDITDGGYETTSKWRVTMPAVTERQLHGRIVLPAGDYTLIWDEVNLYWFLDIGDYLIAYYNDGTDATGDSTLDGTLIYRRSDSGYTTLKLTITGSVLNPSFADGFSAGYADGYANGYADGLANPPEGSWEGTGTGSGTGSQEGTADDEYNLGYEDGYAVGYADGFAAALAEGTGTSEGTI